MPFNLEKQLDLALNLIDQKKDSYKVWWVTLTSIFTAISIVGILTFFSGKIEESNVESFSFFLYLIIPVLIVLVLELFLRSIELHEKRAKIIQMFWKTSQNEASINLGSTFDLILFRIKLNQSSKIIQFIKFRTYFTLFSLLYFEFATFIFIPVYYEMMEDLFLSNTDQLPIPATLVFFGVLILVFMYIIHRKILEAINNWPKGFPWIEKDDREEIKAKEGVKN